MEPIDGEYQVVVIGGGLAGVCAAIAAGRSGCKVALVQDRAVLGGNSSSEVRVAVGGADIDFHWARESGIIEQLRLEDRFRNRAAPCNRNGWLGFMWDIVLYDAVAAEANIELFLNTTARKAHTDATGRIVSVEAVQLGTEKSFVFRASLFVDASGDGAVAADAGAEFMFGRESQSAFGESLAPEKADTFTMGSSILFKAVDVGHPVPFVPPAWAHVYRADNDIPKGRNHADLKGGYAWLEAGGTDMNTISDNEAVRDELLKIVLGIWDHIKNQQDHGAENYAIEWVGAVPGKRESRRFYGDCVLTQNDLEQCTRFDDSVAYSGWPADVHTPGGFHSEGQMAQLCDLPALASVPWRCLYSRNVPNLLLAGRNISASHIGCGTIRVMATCAIIGQAAGTGAALCCKHGVLPRELGQKHIGELQQRLLRDDCYLVGIHNGDPDDLARAAAATASSEQAFPSPPPNFDYELSQAHAALLPVSEPRIETVWLPLRSALDRDAEMTARLIRACAEDSLRSESSLRMSRTFSIDMPARRGCFANESPVAETRFVVPAGLDGEVAVDLNAAVEPGNCYWLLVDEMPGVCWRGIEEHPHHDQFHQSVVSRPVGAKAAFCTPENGWTLYRRGSLNCRITPPSLPYGPANVNNGVARPELWPNIWVSDAAQPLPQWLDLTFQEETTIRSVQIAFDTNLDILVENDPVPSECVKDYALLARINGTWKQLLGIKDNHQRARRHAFGPVATTALRLLVHATHGDPSARVYEIRAYHDE